MPVLKMWAVGTRWVCELQPRQGFRLVPLTLFLIRAAQRASTTCVRADVISAARQAPNAAARWWWISLHATRCAATRHRASSPTLLSQEWKARAWAVDEGLAGGGGGGGWARLAWCVSRLPVRLCVCVVRVCGACVCVMKGGVARLWVQQTC